VQGLGDGAAGVQWVEVPPRRAGDVAVAGTRCHRRGGRAGAARRWLAGLKCYCFNALTDEVLRAVSSVNGLTSLDLWKCQGDRGGASLG
jgi:hypothetical protein